MGPKAEILIYWLDGWPNDDAESLSILQLLPFTAGCGTGHVWPSVTAHCGASATCAKGSSPSGACCGDSTLCSSGCSMKPKLGFTSCTHAATLHSNHRG